MILGSIKRKKNYLEPRADSLQSSMNADKLDCFQNEISDKTKQCMIIMRLITEMTEWARLQTDVRDMRDDFQYWKVTPIADATLGFSCFTRKV